MGKSSGLPSISARQSREIAAFTGHRKVPLIWQNFGIKKFFGAFVETKPNEDKLGDLPRQVLSYISLGKLNKFVIIESEIIITNEGNRRASPFTSMCSAWHCSKQSPQCGLTLAILS
jgi:hypothetical protein